MSKLLLVADDNDNNRAIIEMIAKVSGYTVTGVDDGAKAIVAATKTLFDRVVLDISMPGVDGEEACKKIRAMSQYKNVRIVAYTAHAQPEEIKHLRSIGFDEVIMKPAMKASIKEKAQL